MHGMGRLAGVILTCNVAAFDLLLLAGRRTRLAGRARVSDSSQLLPGLRIQRGSARMSTSTESDFDQKSPYRLPSDDDTIFALSTGATGAAGVAVVRISGSQAYDVLALLTRNTSTASMAFSEVRGQRMPGPRRAVVRRLYDPTRGDLLDEALVLWFPGPRSFTGEDTVELHTHGSRAVIQDVLHALGGLYRLPATPDSSGRFLVRAAERGEFTKRAFGNGRLGLTEVEGLADLLAADTAAQRRQALRQMGGTTERQFRAWRQVLAECLAHTEAVIDFGDDEEDVDESAYEALAPKVQELRNEVVRHLKDAQRGEIIRDGLEVAIVGPPNAGKSSLLNLLARRDAAIVTDIPGTTRDILEVRLDLNGIAVLARDTAGLRENSEDPVEMEGMRRAAEAARSAHLILLVVDVTRLEEARSVAGQLDLLPESSVASLAPEPTEPAEGWEASGRTPVCLVLNKCDRVSEEGHDSSDFKGVALPAEVERLTAALGPLACLRLSCATGVGVEDLVSQVEAKASSLLDTGGTHTANLEPALLTRARHRRHAEGCVAALDAFLEAQGTMPIEVAAEELRVAARELGRVVGAIDVEEVLDVLFRDFCIGK